MPISRYSPSYWLPGGTICPWQEDPEKRISDLERQLGQPRAAEVPGAFTTSDRLTAEQVHHVAFSKPPLFKRGYNEDEVDAFLKPLRPR